MKVVAGEGRVLP